MGSGPVDRCEVSNPPGLRPVRKFEYRYEASRPGLWKRIRRAVRAVYRDLLGGAPRGGRR